MTAIAHGRDEDDSQITEEVMNWQYEGVDEKLQKFMEEEGIDEEELEEIDLDGSDDPVLAKIKDHIEFVKDNPLEKTARQYEKRAHEFLQEEFLSSKSITPELKYDFETVSWYCTLFPAKVHRALCGFHEEMAEGDIALYDAVAQFDICLDGMEKSLPALRRLKNRCPQYDQLIDELLALLQNLSSRVTVILENL